MVPMDDHDRAMVSKQRVTTGTLRGCTNGVRSVSEST